MHDLPLHEVMRLVAAANAGGEGERQQLDALFGTGERLAVYGTLAPGQPNHGLVAPLGGEWTEGIVEGDLYPTGWGAIVGYPACRPRRGGADVKVEVLTTAALPAAWPMLDEFEGPEYRRILVAVFRHGAERRLYTVAHLYAARE